jgi:hypothetical protein
MSDIWSLNYSVLVLCPVKKELPPRPFASDFLKNSTSPLKLPSYFKLLLFPPSLRLVYVFFPNNYPSENNFSFVSTVNGTSNSFKPSAGN